MMLRARHLFFAWLTYGALQFALLGVGGVSGAQVGIGRAGVRAQAELPAVPHAKRALGSELVALHAPITPFAPSVPFRLDLPALAHHESPQHQPRRGATAGARLRPPARAPPGLS